MDTVKLMVLFLIQYKFENGVDADNFKSEFEKLTNEDVIKKDWWSNCTIKLISMLISNSALWITKII